MQIRDVADSCATLESISRDPVMRGGVFKRMGETAMADLNFNLWKALAATPAGASCRDFARRTRRLHFRALRGPITGDLSDSGRGA